MTDYSRPDQVPETGTTTTPHESSTPIATTPVGVGAADVAVPTPKRSRVRWLAALGIVTLVVAASAAAALLLTGSSPAATVVGYVPADSIVYGEVRLDLPGDQRRQVGEFLSKFPGFADQASLETKVDEVLDRLVSDVSAGEQTYSADIKPWFDGELAFAVGPLPGAGALSDPARATAASRGLLLLSIKDEGLARAWFDEVMTQNGVAGTAETYDGVALTVFSEPDMADAKGAFGIIGGKVAVAGDLASVKAAIDTKGNGGLSAAPAYTSASGAMDGDHVGYLFVDLRSLMASVTELSGAAGQGAPLSAAMLDLIPEWTAVRLRVEGDALLMDSAFPHIADAGPADARANGVPDWAPPGTIMLAAGNDYGAGLQRMIDLYRAEPSMAELFTGIDQAAGILGGTEAVIGWIGDAGVVVSRDGDAVEGGLVIVPTDPAAARQLLTTIRSFVTLGGGGQGISVREEEHGGTTITIIDLGTAESLIGMAGALGGGTLPTDPSAIPDLPSGNIEISYAAADGVVVLGSGPDFVRSVLDAGAGASLADAPRFKDLIARVGAAHTGLTFVDIAAFRGIMEGFLADMPAAERAEYEESVKPFLTPFDAMISAGTVGADVDGQHIVITVK